MSAFLVISLVLAGFGVIGAIVGFALNSFSKKFDAIAEQVKLINDKLDDRVSLKTCALRRNAMQCQALSNTTQTLPTVNQQNNTVMLKLLLHIDKLGLKLDNFNK